MAMFKFKYHLIAALTICTTTPVYAADTILPGEIRENYLHVDVFDYLYNQGYLINYGAYNFLPGSMFYNMDLTENYGDFWFGANSSSRRSRLLLLYILNTLKGGTLGFRV